MVLTRTKRSDVTHQYRRPGRYRSCALAVCQCRHLADPKQVARRRVVYLPLITSTSPRRPYLQYCCPPRSGAALRSLSRCRRNRRRSSGPNCRSSFHRLRISIIASVRATQARLSPAIKHSGCWSFGPRTFKRVGAHRQELPRTPRRLPRHPARTSAGDTRTVRPGARRGFGLGTMTRTPRAGDSRRSCCRLSADRRRLWSAQVKYRLADRGVEETGDREHKFEDRDATVFSPSASGLAEGSTHLPRPLARRMAALTWVDRRSPVFP